VDGPGNIFVVSAPSGTGKRTILNRILAMDNRLELAVSTTTRPPRTGETAGVDYTFVTEDEFDAMLDADAFVEWAMVHGNRYGTPRSELERLAAEGKDALLEVDVQGMRNVRNAGIDAVTIFIAPPSLTELERRMRARATESEDQIALRMNNAREEMAARREYDYVVTNDLLDDAVKAVEHIIRDVRQG
jgi:guanylate kinase